MFITLEDETGVANLISGPDLFEKRRRIVLGASMMGVRGRVQSDAEIIHVVAQRPDDMSPLLASVGRRQDLSSVYQVSRADVARNPLSPDPRNPAERALGRAPRDIYIADCVWGGASFQASRPKE